MQVKSVPRQKSIPLVDVTGDKSIVASRLWEALTTTGFCYVVNTPFTKENFHLNVLQETKHFFLDHRNKQQCPTNEQHTRGYYRYHGLGLGEKTTISSDLIEAFVFGNEESDPKSLKHDYFASDPKNEEKYWHEIAKTYTNQWPSEKSSGNFRNIMKKGFRLSSESCHGILMLLASKLGISSEQLSSMHNKNDHTMELKHYCPITPVVRPNPTTLAANISMNSELDNDGEAIRVKSHADLSTLTLLTQNLETKGLQILIDSQDGEQTWLDAPPIPGAVLINSGDVMQLLSNGKVPSTKHRVIADETSSISRFSVVHFYVPNWETRMSDTILFGDMTPF